MDELSSVLSVRGHAVLEVDPELAYVWVTTKAHDEDRGKAMRLLDEAATEVDEILADFVGVIERTETTRLMISPRLKDLVKGKQRVWGYDAAVRRTVIVSRFERLGDLVARLAGQDLTEVHGPEWVLRRDSPVYRQARLDAVQDAVRSARDYAAGLGTALSHLVELSDSNLLSGGRAGQGVLFAGMKAHAREAAPETFTFDVNPARQIVETTVEARFAMVAPDLTAPAPPA